MCCLMYLFIFVKKYLNSTQQFQVDNSLLSTSVTTTDLLDLLLMFNWNFISFDQHLPSLPPSSPW
jgi:hypothetical protein